MNVSVYSVVSAIVFFNIGLLFVKWFRCNTKFLIRNSTAVLFVLGVLSLIRLLFPADLEDAKILTSKTVLPAIVNLLETPVVQGISIIEILLAIWGIGTVLILSKSVYILMREMQQVKKYQPIEATRIQKIAEECLDGEAVVMVSPDVDVPKVMGIKKAHIYMPPLTLTDEEIRLVLLHEFQHVKGRDFFVKLFYLFLKAFFWWNPVVYFFHQEVENLLELRCDAAVTKSMTDRERIAYLEAVLNVMKQATLRDAKPFTNMAALINLEKKSFMQQRFEVILNKTIASKRRNIRSLCVICLFIATFVCSYFVIVQPAYEPPVDEIEDYVEITNENAYIAIGENDELELYIDGKPFGTLEKEELDIDPYDGLKIIEKEGRHE